MAGVASTSARPKQALVVGSSAGSTSGMNHTSSETEPLLNNSRKAGKRKKPFYRARPLWLVPFGIIASIVRGMTLAPRVEIYTQLSCTALYGDHDWNHTQHDPSISSLQPSDRYTTLLTAMDPVGPHIHSSTLFSPRPAAIDFINTSTIILGHSPLPIGTWGDDGEPEEDPRRLPSSRCQSDPDVQAGAARIQTIMTTTMGLLSALTTGWWGQFGERHGRTKVLAISTFGLFLTDLTFILVSTPSSALSKHGHKLLIVAPIVEGLLGGWSTLQSATSSYLSDCTSSGSRAHIFSRFTGVIYVGFSLGPSIGAYLIQHPLKMFESVLPVGGKTVTSVFWVAIWLSFVNFLGVLFVFPESLAREKRELARRLYNKNGGDVKGKARRVAVPVEEVGAELGDGEQVEDEEVDVAGEESGATASTGGRGGIISQFLSPLALFLPVVVMDPSGLGRKRRDWSLTLLAGALFAYMLSAGVFQIKYLYSVHTYNWSAEQLGFYISLMGGLRALFLLLILPTIIRVFKPKRPSAVPKGKGKLASQPLGAKKPVKPASDVSGKKSKPSRTDLGREISFDLTLTRCSLIIDIISHSLVAILPAPNVVHQMRSSSSASASSMSDTQSQVAFVLASALNSFGTGSVPAISSLALCIVQLRALDRQAVVAGGESSVVQVEEEGTGPLFGALAVLQAVGQMILGPLLFGLVYSSTVAGLPKAIFVLVAIVCVLALSMVLLVRNPVRPPPSKSAVAKGKQPARRKERGRSRSSKDLRGGAVPYYPDSHYGATSSGTASDASERV